MAHGHHVLLLWFNISGFCVPPILLVCVVYPFSKRMVKVPFFGSMRYSRMLEESSFANKKADYFWLLFLSSLMLLVKTKNSLSPDSTKPDFYSRDSHHYSIYPSCHRPLRSYQYTCGHDDIPPRQSHCLG